MYFQGQDTQPWKNQPITTSSIQGRISSIKTTKTCTTSSIDAAHMLAYLMKWGYIHRYWFPWESQDDSRHSVTEENCYLSQDFESYFWQLIKLIMDKTGNLGLVRNCKAPLREGRTNNYPHPLNGVSKPPHSTRRSSRWSSQTCMFHMSVEERQTSS